MTKVIDLGYHNDMCWSRTKIVCCPWRHLDTIDILSICTQDNILWRYPSYRPTWRMSWSSISCPWVHVQRGLHTSTCSQQEKRYLGHWQWWQKCRSNTDASSVESSYPQGHSYLVSCSPHRLIMLTSSSCSADLYGMDELKKLALRKQGLQTGVHIGSILASARWAYDHTPDTESSLRSHYLSVIIRNRNHFKKSQTMQAEMEQGGKLFFDLFVTMCGHMNDVNTIRSPYTRWSSLVSTSPDNILSYESLYSTSIVNWRSADGRQLYDLYTNIHAANSHSTWHFTNSFMIPHTTPESVDLCTL